MKNPWTAESVSWIWDTYLATITYKSLGNLLRQIMKVCLHYIMVPNTLLNHPQPESQALTRTKTSFVCMSKTSPAEGCCPVSQTSRVTRAPFWQVFYQLRGKGTWYIGYRLFMLPWHSVHISFTKASHVATPTLRGCREVQRSHVPAGRENWNICKQPQ